ncbi:MAG: hypothetical protein ACFHU9_07055 [Fluviicola sp.]
MQKRLLFIELAMFLLLFISWFLPYAYHITPWEYMFDFEFVRWDFAVLVTAPMLTPVFLLLDRLLREDILIRKMGNVLLSVIYGIVICWYLSQDVAMFFLNPEIPAFVLFSLILFLYSFLIQKGTSFMRNVVLCTMTVPVGFHMYELYGAFEYGAWLLNISFILLIIIAFIRPFVAPKVN